MKAGLRVEELSMLGTLAELGEQASPWVLGNYPPQQAEGGQEAGGTCQPNHRH